MEKDKRKEDDNEGEERIWSIAQNEQLKKIWLCCLRLVLHYFAALLWEE